MTVRDNRVIHAALLVLMACCPHIGHSDQGRISSYNSARYTHFYPLYLGASSTESTDVYCGAQFKVTAKPSGGLEKPAWISIEHAYPAKWMMDSLGCTGNREECRKDPDPHLRARFNHAEGDMHNMWPALGPLNSARGDRQLGMLDGEETRVVKIKNGPTFTCDFEQEGDVVEPRPIVRGNLARSIFYMCEEYDFAVPEGMMPVLRLWNKEDPPTRAEIRREREIGKVQGTRNRFVTEPMRADTLQCRQLSS